CGNPAIQPVSTGYIVNGEEAVPPS
nr:chymotrypsin isoenzyme ChT1 {N-terminal} [Atlantic cod, pyloric ceca, Peptide Partial, 24 aa] [Gadus morhua]